MPQQYSGQDPKGFGVPDSAPRSGGRSADDFKGKIGKGKTPKPTPREAWENANTKAPKWPFRPKRPKPPKGKGKR